jgi:hypothetical protein
MQDAMFASVFLRSRTDTLVRFSDTVNVGPIEKEFLMKPQQEPERT